MPLPFAVIPSSSVAVKLLQSEPIHHLNRGLMIEYSKQKHAYTTVLSHSTDKAAPIRPHTPTLTRLNVGTTHTAVQTQHTGVNAGLKVQRTHSSIMTQVAQCVCVAGQ